MPSSNLLILSVSKACQDALLANAVGVPLMVGDELFRRGEPAESAWFVESGMVSILAPVDGSERVEVGVVGWEGLAGLSVMSGGPVMTCSGVVQCAGSALKVDAVDLQSRLEEFAELRRVMLRYAEIFLIQVAQTAACNAKHDIPQRLARWLLVASDRTDSYDIAITHESLAWLLGVRRAGVTTALHLLEGERAIRSTRGHVVIRDRQKLEHLSCSCRSVVRSRTEELLGRGTLVREGFRATGPSTGHG